MNNAPIILFAYNRPELLRKTLTSLAGCELADSSSLFIFSDGPKANASASELQKIKEVRAIAIERKWCASVELIAAETNKGLAHSVIDGVSQIVKKYGKVIVVEDDVLLAPVFLRYMNDALELYQNDDRVVSIGSWNYFSNANDYKDDTFFFRFPDSIAWATFDRAWKLFEENGEKLMSDLKKKKLLKRFNGNLDYPYFSNMLQNQIDHKINSWAIRWTALAVLHNKLTLLPAKSLSKHIGFSPDATHEKASKDYNSDIDLNVSSIKVGPIEKAENSIAIEKWRRFYLHNFIPNFSTQMKARHLLKGIVPDSLLQTYRKIRYGKNS